MRKATDPTREVTIAVVDRPRPRIMPLPTSIKPQLG